MSGERAGARLVTGMGPCNFGRKVMSGDSAGAGLITGWGPCKSAGKVISGDLEASDFQCCQFPLDSEKILPPLLRR